MAVCEYCKKEFVPGHGSGGKYCSRECCKRYRAEYGFAAKKKDIPAVLCSSCGKLFHPYTMKQATALKHYCSQKCQWESLKKKPDATCPVCGKLFVSNDDHRLYCSKQCRMQWERDKAEQNRILRQKEAEEKKRQRIAEREATREQALERQRQYEEKKQEEARIARMHPCEICGTMTDRPKYCSQACANRAENRRIEVKRRHKLRENGKVDYSISLEGLILRDKNVCHICGRKCDQSDYQMIGGVFIAGNMYPSIDHVIAVANGGTHEWDNVKLAHRICNSIKNAEAVHEAANGQLMLWV